MPGFISDFATVDANNVAFNGISTNVNAMKPSDARKFTQALSGALARWHNDLGATPTVGGTATAVTVTLNQAFTAYGASAGQIANGEVIALKMTSAATGATTLNINAIGTKAIRREGDTAIAANDWLANSTVLLRYDTAYNSAAGAWVLLNQNSTGAIAPLLLTASSVGPNANNTISSGTTTNQWSGVNIGSGGAIQWDASGSGVLLSQSGNSLVLQNGAGAGGLIVKGNLDLSQVGGSVYGQIVFPASQNASANANTLDDYAEGTTTPTVTSGTGAFTTVACTLTYTKIGNRVLWDAVVTITTNNTAATSIIIPLPFTVGAGVAFAGINSTSNFAMVGSAANTQTAATFVKYDGTYPGGSGITLRVGGEYRV